MMKRFVGRHYNVRKCYLSSSATPLKVQQRIAALRKDRLRQAEANTNPVALIMFMNAKNGNSALALSSIPEWTNSLKGSNLTAQDISFCLFGLKNYSDATLEAEPSLHDFLELISEKIRTSNEIFYPINLSQCFLGLKGFSVNDKSVQEILLEVAKKVDECPAQFDIKELSNIVAGIQHMCKKHHVTKTVVSSILRKASGLASAKGPELSVSAITQLFSGLKAMDASNEETQALMTAMCDWMLKSNTVFDSKAISLTLQSLHDLPSHSSNIGATEKLISQLVDKIFSSKAVLSSYEMGCAVYGLKNMNNTNVEIDRLLRILATKLQQINNGDFKSNELSNLVFGLQSMSAVESPGFQAFLTEVLKVLKHQLEASVTLSQADAAQMVMGLRSMSSGSSSEVRNLVAIVCKYLAQSNISFADPATLRAALIGMQGFSEDIRENRQFMALVVNSLKRDCHGEFLDKETMRAMFFTMSSFDGKTPEAHELCAVLGKLIIESRNIGFSDLDDVFRGLETKHISLFVNKLLMALVFKLDSLPFDDAATLVPLDSLADCLNELRRIDINECKRTHIVGLRKLLGSLTRILMHSKEKLTASQFERMLHGMKGMGCVFAECRSLLSVLATKLEHECAPNFEFVESSYLGCFVGMSSFNSEIPEIQRLIKVLMPKLAAYKGNINSTDLGFILNALQSFSCDENDSVVAKLIDIVTDKVKTCTGNLSGPSISLGLYGLQNFSSASEAVVRLLNAVNDATTKETVTERMSFQDVCMSLYGLQGMSSSVPSVIDLFNHFNTSLVPTNRPKASRFGIGMAIYGLQNKDSTVPVVAALISKLTEAVNELDETAVPAQEMHILAMSVFIVETLLARTKEVAALLSSLQSKLKKAEANLLPSSRKEQQHGQDESAKEFVWEQRVRNIAVTTFANDPTIEVELNRYLFHFEADIILRCHRNQGMQRKQRPLVINIEIDGIYHGFNSNKKFCQLRDRALVSKHGVWVIRWNAQELLGLSDPQIVEKLRAVAQLSHC